MVFAKFQGYGHLCLLVYHIDTFSIYNMYAYCVVLLVKEELPIYTDDCSNNMFMC